MNKFIERAKELKARLSLLCYQSDISTAVQQRIDLKSGDVSREKELQNLGLDILVLLSEFNCPPLYEEVCQNRQNPDRLIYLLDKLIETAEFRQQ